MHLGSRFLQTRGLWRAHGLPWILQSRLWLSNYVLFSLFAWCNHWVTCYEWKFVQWISIGQWKWILYVKNACLIQGLYFVYVVETCITLHWKASYTYMSPFSSLLLVKIHLLFSIKPLICRGFNFIVTHICFQWRVCPPGIPCFSHYTIYAI